MKFIIIFLSFLLLTGCEIKTSTKKSPEVDNTYSEMEKKAETIKCTEEQYVLVERDYALCSQTTYKNIYCYNRAITIYCSAVVY